MDMLPKPTSRHLPLLITGSSQQDPGWIARNGDGWMVYPRNLALQERVVRDYRGYVEQVGRPMQPVLQPLYIDLTEDPDSLPQPIHLGFRLGVNSLRSYLKSLEEIGINHNALNLRFNRADIEKTITRLAKDIVPDFSG